MNQKENIEQNKVTIKQKLETHNEFMTEGEAQETLFWPTPELNSGFLNTCTVFSADGDLNCCIPSPTLSKKIVGLT